MSLNFRLYLFGSKDLQQDLLKSVILRVGHDDSLDKLLIVSTAFMFSDKFTKHLKDFMFQILAAGNHPARLVANINVW